MNFRSTLILILFLIWGSGSTYWYVCKIKGFCVPQEKVSVAIPDKGNKTEIPEDKPVVKHDLLYYLWGKIRPVVSDTAKWKAEVKSIKQLQAEGKKLRIEAPYYKNEPYNGDFDNLGIARANALKKMLSNDIDSALIITGSKLLNPNDSVYKTEFINGYKDYLKWITFNNYVQEKRDKTFIYFPYNSTREIKNKDILNYMNALAERLKTHPEEKVMITGFTDNVGSAASNKILGLKRAKRVRKLLIKNGVPSKQIMVKSEGKNKPIADNTTKEGRQKNRRVEITIIK